VRFAIGLPNVGAYGDPGLLVELGSLAEQSGWDGVFIWDHVAYREPGWPVADPQVAVAALAATTKHVRLGVLMVALPRRRPWKVARELASLDVLSGGRATFGAGLGSQPLEEYEAFGEQGAPGSGPNALMRHLRSSSVSGQATHSPTRASTTRSRTASFSRAQCSDRGSPYGSPTAGRHDDHSPAPRAGMGHSRLTLTSDPLRR
jgi:hypothetical protein